MARVRTRGRCGMGWSWKGRAGRARRGGTPPPLPAQVIGPAGQNKARFGADTAMRNPRSWIRTDPYGALPRSVRTGVEAHAEDHEQADGDEDGRRHLLHQ